MTRQISTQRKSIVIVIVVGIAFLCVAILEFAQAYSNWRRENILTASSEVTQGVVTNLYSISGRSPQLWVDYRFRLGTPDDVIDLSGSQSVSQDFYNVLTVGKAVAIRYDQFDPTVSEIDGQPASVMSPLALGGLILVGAVICGVALIRVMRKKQAQ